MNENREHHVIDVLFVIALFCIFALSAVFLISIGANIYGKTVSNMESNFNERTGFAYVTEKIRQADSDGAVSIGDFDGIPALLIARSGGEDSYITYLYAYNGYLKELMVRKDTPLSPEAGQDILAVSEFSLQQINDRLFTFTICAEGGESCRLFVSTKSKEGGSVDES